MGDKLRDVATVSEAAAASLAVGGLTDWGHVPASPIECIFPAPPACPAIGNRTAERRRIVSFSTSDAKFSLKANLATEAGNCAEKSKTNFAHRTASSNPTRCCDDELQ